MMFKKIRDDFFEACLPDLRIQRRANKVMQDMFTFGKATVNMFCGSNTEKIGAYRMFGNNSFSHLQLLEGVTGFCKGNQGPEHLLCFQDTTELNFTHHLGRIGKDDPDIGPITKNDNGGFFCHPVLVVDAQRSTPVGISYARLWNRKWDKSDKYERNYNSQDIEEKESYRWIEAALHTKSLLSETPILTVIGDREADIYEELATVPSKNIHLLIRASRNRILAGENIYLYEFLEAQEQNAEYEIKVKGNKKRQNRTARITLKYAEVELNKPKKKKLHGYPDSVKIWAIEAKETTDTTPEYEEPIHWRLLTTHEIGGVQDALECIKWYTARWLIEELFRVLKSQGMDIESSQLETGAALKKLTVMAMQVALTTLMLKLSYDKPQKIQAKTIFTEEQIRFLHLLLTQLEGKSQKQQNPFPKNTLEWCAWCVARLSGWSGYKSHGPPGYISIKRGLDIFFSKYDGYLIALDLIKP
jgi:hypothetical protein